MHIRGCDVDFTCKPSTSRRYLDRSILVKVHDLAHVHHIACIVILWEQWNTEADGDINMHDFHTAARRIIVRCMMKAEAE